jgi:hypothetical protein
MLLILLGQYIRYFESPTLAGHYKELSEVSDSVVGQ